MPTRIAPSTDEIVALFLRQRSSNVRALRYFDLVDTVRRELRTTTPTARKWVDNAVYDPASPLVEVRAAYGQVTSTIERNEAGIRLSRELDGPKLTNDGFLAESRDDRDDTQDSYWILLKTTLEDMIERQKGADARRQDEQKQARRTELSGFRERYGQDSIRLLRGLLAQAGIEHPHTALRVHYDQGDGPLALGPYITIDLNGGRRGGQDQIAAFLDLLRTLGVQPVAAPKKES